MKKLLSVILALSMSLAALPVSGSEADKLEKVLISVKERIPNTESYEEFNSSVMENYGEKVYSFDWSYNKNETYKSMSVTVTEDGIITNYRLYDDTTYLYHSTPSINKMSSDDALIKAQKLVDELNPSIAGEIKVIKTNENESLFENTYRFELQRVIDSVPVYNNTGYVTVGENAKDIIGYNLDYTPNLTFEKKDNLIGTDNAWKAFYEKAGLELRYIAEYKDSKKSVYLAYLPKIDYQQYIDAKTGEISDIWERYYVYGGMNYKEEFSADSAGGGALNESVRLSEVELEKLSEVADLKTVEEAQNAVKNNKFLDFEDELKLNSLNLYKGYNEERYYYDMTFENYIDEEYRYASVTLDAKTLEIIRWRARTKDYMEYRQNYEENIKELDKEDVFSKANTALEHIAPKYFSSDEIDYRVNESEKTSNSIGYIRYVNDIVFYDDYINIEINPQNGKVWSFSMNYSDIEFPSPEGIISEQAAVEKLSEQKELELLYFPCATQDGMLNADYAKLGYKTSDISSVKIDAFDGKIKEYESQQKLAYKDISNHYAKEQIETLAKFGIGFEGEEFRPDEIITQNEYITLLMATFSYYTPIILKSTNETSAEYKDAQRVGVIKPDEQNPNEALTREYAAIYMIRVLGIEEYAKLDSIYKSIFDDVSKNVGYISILGAMGVFNGDENGLFNPDKNLTRADAAIIIYNYLSR